MWGGSPTPRRPLPVPLVAQEEAEGQENQLASSPLPDTPQPSSSQDLKGWPLPLAWHLTPRQEAGKMSVLQSPRIFGAELPGEGLLSPSSHAGRHTAVHFRVEDCSHGNTSRAGKAAAFCGHRKAREPPGPGFLICKVTWTLSCSQW